jgi:mannose-6-phosphate isomerase-like protein (cupin superfamily)
MMASMKAPFTIDTFSLPRAAVHLAANGDAALLQGDDLRLRLRHLGEGHLLGVFPLASAGDLHAEWEMHRAGDEVLFMLAGSLDVEYSDGARGGISPLGPRQAMVMPKGLSHRLVLREPGLLLALSPLEGTEKSRVPRAAAHSPRKEKVS